MAYDDFNTSHAKLGHIKQDRMASLARASLLGSVIKVHLPRCEPWLTKKATKKPL